jgi:hypothetical protein
MTEQRTAEGSSRAGKMKTDQAYLDLWHEYRRGTLSADEFLHRLEHEFLRRVEQLEHGGRR